MNVPFCLLQPSVSSFRLTFRTGDEGVEFQTRLFAPREKEARSEEAGMLRTAERDRSFGFSFPPLNRSGANINTRYRASGPERHAWTNDTLSLPSFFALGYTSKLMRTPTAVGKREREAELEAGRRGPAAFFPRLPCRCCSTPDSGRRIAPTSSGKRISCNKGGINKTMMNANVIHPARPPAPARRRRRQSKTPRLRS